MNSAKLHRIQSQYTKISCIFINDEQCKMETSHSSGDSITKNTLQLIKEVNDLYNETLQKEK